jgi:hypothetical protein
MNRAITRSAHSNAIDEQQARNGLLVMRICPLACLLIVFSIIENKFKRNFSLYPRGGGVFCCNTMGKNIGKKLYLALPLEELAAD